eukprot:1960060-Heterocapsa_arctica.AAC.1
MAALDNDNDDDAGTTDTEEEEDEEEPNTTVHVYHNTVSDPLQYYHFSHSGAPDELQEALRVEQQRRYGHPDDGPYLLYQLTADWRHDTAYRHIQF